MCPLDILGDWTINIVVSFATCQCNLQPFCAWFGRSKPQDEYIALEQNCIPEDCSDGWARWCWLGVRIPMLEEGGELTLGELQKCLVLADWKVKEEPGKSCVARVFAVVIVLFAAGMGLLYILGSVTSSLEKVNMKTYQTGFNQMENSVLAFMQWIDPKYKEELATRMDQVESHVASMVLGAFNDILSNTTSFATQLVMFLLYSLMCILSPIKQGEQVFTIVRTYFLYKAICNAVFRCDLAVLLSVICFFLSFIPEVGSVICILMPAPVLLFDSRVTMEIRITNAIGMLLIKFAVSNGLESLVMSRSAVLSGQMNSEESNDETHPVDWLADAEHALLDPTETLQTAEVQGGDCLTTIVQEAKVAATCIAFALWCCGGDRTVTWGHPDDGGDSSEVQDQLKGVQQINASSRAFAAILADGSVVTWGHPDHGGDSSEVQDQLKGVHQVQASACAFAGILADGSVVTWGHPDYGADSSEVQDQLKGVHQVQAGARAFAAILVDGFVGTWGHPDHGGDSSEVQDQLKGVHQVQATDDAFAAILADGSVVTWGHPDHGGDSAVVADQFAAL
eukprot:s1310_g9.t1